MSLKQRIEADIKAAMLAKQKEELTALRSIKSMILLAETEKGSSGELSEETENKLLMKAAKQRKESAEIFEKEGRKDLADKEMFEWQVISKYLPQQLTEDELRQALQALITELNVSSAKEMGKVMGMASKKFAGKADGKLIADIIKQLLPA
ncbi:MAG TPA: GatB/YqeY domain-containing protein [Cyclobacteriaceae bacterium]|nr:GatB/YqeY domain-containing protein [Cyclobacteriaceae bacterium]